MRIGIDLLWVRPGKCGGTESYIRNLLDGFARYCPEHEFVLYAARDNVQSFSQYGQYPNMSLTDCPVDCAVQRKRIVWENIRLARLAERSRVEVMFIPVYSKPLTFGSRIPYVTVIHDLQALHYPQYFSRFRLMFMKSKWKYACKTSAQLLTDSDFCRQDIISNYPFVKGKIRTVYVPIVSSGKAADFSRIGEKYGICARKYFYCVSSMLPHKNLITILKVMSALKKAGTPAKLVLSGVGGQSEEFMAELKNLDIEDAVIQTDFVSDEERDCLYENCEIFLFPSIFEGFGMPPIEAMSKGRPVVMTGESCLKEVTEGKAIYVEQPLRVEEWIQKIGMAREKDVKAEAFPKYELKTITEQFMEVFEFVTHLQ